MYNLRSNKQGAQPAPKRKKTPARSNKQGAQPAPKRKKTPARSNKQGAQPAPKRKKTPVENSRNFLPDHGDTPLFCFNRIKGGIHKHCVQPICLNRTYLENLVIESKDAIGSGLYSSVYNVKTPWGANLALKVMNLEWIPNFLEMRRLKHGYSSYFDKDVTLSKIAAGLGVGPQIYDNWKCSDVKFDYSVYEPISDKIYKDQNDLDTSLGFILMDRIEGLPLSNYATEFPDKYEINKNQIREILYKKLKTLSINGYRYTDLHAGNVMIEFKHPNIVNDVKLIDFADMNLKVMENTTLINEWHELKMKNLYNNEIL
jgi:hypothetical protein